MKKERAKIPVPEEEYYTLFGYPLTKEELNLAGRELLALGFTATGLNARKRLSLAEKARLGVIG